MNSMARVLGDPRILLVIALALLTALVVYRLDAVHASERLTRRKMWLIALPIIIIALVGTVLHRRVDPDEAEHLHTAWLMTTGARPFTDFFCHHSPLLGYALQPLVAVLPASAVVVDAARVVSLLVTAVAAVAVVGISRRLWGNECDLWAAGMVLTSLAWLEVVSIRPDVPAAALGIWAVLVLATGPPRRAGLLAGVLMGCAVCFTPKHLPLLVLGPVVALWSRERDWVVAGAYVVGAAIPVAVLAGALNHAGLLAPAWEWVVLFNRQIQFTSILDHFIVHMPLGITGLAVGGCVYLGRTGRLATGRLERTVVLALMLATLSENVRVFAFDRQLAVLLAAAVAAAPARWAWRYLHERSIPLASVAVTVVIAPFVIPIFLGVVQSDYLLGRAQIQALIELSEGESVVCRIDKHPIVRADATDLWQLWQWSVWLSRPEIQERLISFVSLVISQRPAVVHEPTWSYRSLVEVLLEEGVIPEGEADRLWEFLHTHYRLIALGHKDQEPTWFWVRNDLLCRVPAKMVLEIAPLEPVEASACEAARHATSVSVAARP